MRNSNGASLAGANLDGATLVSASFRGTCLKNATLVRSIVSNTVFRRANLSYADLSQIFCPDGGYSSSDLDEDVLTANFSNAVLFGVRHAQSKPKGRNTTRNKLL